MAKRNIGKEIIQGLHEVKAWRQGKAKLKAFTVELPRAADVPAIRSRESFANRNPKGMR